MSIGNNCSNHWEQLLDPCLRRTWATLWPESRFLTVLQYLPESLDDPFWANGEKDAESFANGVQMVWIVDPQLAQIYGYRDLERLRLLCGADVLTGEEILPGFQVALSEISNSQFGLDICVTSLISTLFTLNCHAERSEASLRPWIFQGNGMLRRTSA